MDRQVVEVVARFDGTIIDHRHLDANASYRIGMSPWVDLIVPGLSSFPLVERGTVRTPAGCSIANASGATELQLGAIHIRIARTTLGAIAMPRPRFDVRPIVFVLASLIAHIAVWWIATARAPFERVAHSHLRTLPIHVARFVEPPLDPPAPTPPPKPAPAPISPAPRRASSAAQLSNRPRGARPGPGAAHHAEKPLQRGIITDESVAAIHHMMESFDKLDLQHTVGDLTAETSYDEDRANLEGFGGTTRFDPDKREGWGTVASGRFETSDYDVTTCPDAKCTVTGPIPALWIRMYVHKFLPEIGACWDQAGHVPGEITIEFTIAGDGSVHDARGEGLDGAGACAANVAATFVFKARGEETHVRYPIRFNAPYRL